MLPTDPIREFLKKNNFYIYRTDACKVSENYLQEYKDTAEPSNKRNLNLNKFWEDITAFGKPRRILVMDLGGTNLNTFDVSVKDEKTIEVERTASTSFYQDKVYTPEILFGDLKKELDMFILASEERAALENFVFIFSYPIHQVIREDGYIDAICTNFIKEHKSEGIIGLQVGQAFQDYLRENGYPKIKISVTNDTPIHAFAAKGYEILHGEAFDAAMNIIVGTGCNVSTAYNEKEREDVKGLRIINTEFGDFKSMTLSRFDEEFDLLATSPGIHLNEKMISGAYQHEIFKIIVKNLIQSKLVSDDIIDSFDLENLDSGGIEKKLKHNGLTEEQQCILGFIWREINKRGGAICGLFLAGVMTEIYERLKKPFIDIIIMETGSVIQKNEGFRESVLDTLDCELGRLEKKGKITYSFKGLPHQAAYGSVIFDTFSSQ